MLTVEELLLQPHVLAYYADNPIDYVKEVIGATPDDIQAEILNSCAKNQLTSVRSGHGVGKEMPYSTMLDTPMGKRRWGEIVPGDFLFGANGKPTKVIARHEQGIKPMFKITFDDGSFCYCGEDHLWNVRGRQERRNKIPGWRTVSTAEIIRLGVKRSNGAVQARQWEIPVQGAAEFPEQKTALHPYVMGLWLGDGSVREAAYSKPYQEIANKVRALGYKLSQCKERFRLLENAHLFKGGVFECHSYDRYIPDEYKYNSVEKRMALFQGLCDTDGEVNRSGSIGYSTTSQKLATDIAWLARSLGCKAMLQPTEKQGWYYDSERNRVNCLTCYRITINAPFNPFTLRHRKDKYKPSECRYTKRWIDSIEYSHDEQAMCVTVEAADGLYLANDFIVTHNSTVESWVAKWVMFSRPFPKVPCTAPTQHQLHDILWAELNKWNRQSADSFLFEWTDKRFYHKAHREEWFAVPRTATQPDALQGFHADHVFYIIDEASGVADKIFEPVLGALSTEGAGLLACGNPTQLAGWFFDSHNSKREMYSTFHVDGRNSSRVSPKYVKMIIDMFGEDSDVFRVRVAGQFPKAMPDSFIPLDWVERNSVKVPLIIVPKSIDIGVDVARYGDDQSVLCPVFDRRHQMEPEIYNHNNTMELAGRTMQMLDRYTSKYGRIPMSVRVDCDGLGVGTYDRVAEVVKSQRMSHVKVYEGHFGGSGGKVSAGDPVKYANSTGLMWGLVRELLRTNQLSLWYNDTQISQLTNRKYRVNSDGEIELERKEEMKKRGLKSPDLGDGLALALWQPRKVGFSMQV